MIGKEQLDAGKVEYFLGIDVQVERGCAYALLDREGRMCNSGWATGIESVGPGTANLVDVIADISEGDPEVISVGIDAPRQPLQRPRDWYWERQTRSWRRRRRKERGWGRHCEVVVAAHGIGNPQWTPLLPDAPDWMKLGFKLFEALSVYPMVYEAFPSASYKMLVEDRDLMVCIDFAKFSKGPKDMLDACVAAATVKEFVQSRGEEVGGGDGLGTIILPRPIGENRMEEVFKWP